MKINFKIDDHSGVNYKGRHIDLHNNFDFVGYDFSMAERKLTLIWKKSSGDWIDENEFSRLVFIHSNTSFINIVYDNSDNDFPEDDFCLSIISFFPSSDREINNGFIYQEIPKEGDDIIYIFQTEHFIRVNCDDLELIVE